MVTEYPLPSPGAVPDHIASGPDGNLWFTEYAELGRNWIGQITPAGAVTEYPIPTMSSAADNIAAAGPVLWFTEHTANSHPDGIAVGPDRAVWFVELAGNNVARLGS